MIMNDATFLSIGILTACVALVGFPFMFSRRPVFMLTGIYLATPFVVFMFLLTFVVGR